jgi:hypothetical protein
VRTWWRTRKPECTRLPTISNCAPSHFCEVFVAGRDVWLPSVQPLIGVGRCRNARIDIELAVFASEEHERTRIHVRSRCQRQHMADNDEIVSAVQRPRYFTSVCLRATPGSAALFMGDMSEQGRKLMAMMRTVVGDSHCLGTAAMASPIAITTWWQRR